MPIDIFCSEAPYVHTDPDTLLSLLKSLVSVIDHRIHTSKKKGGIL